MNCNEFGNIRGRNKNFRGRGARAVNVQRAVIGRTRKSVTRKTTSTNLGSSTSSIKWKNNSALSNNITYTVSRSSSSRTCISSDLDSRVIVAIAAGRGEATCEIGLAAVDICKPTLILCHISDMPSYINTLTKINILNPHEILLPMTFIDTPSSNRLVNKIKEHFKNITITAVPRLTYNKSNGMNIIKQLCASQWDSILLVLQHKYYCLTAASALFTYTESVLYVIFNKNSLKVEYQESEGYCIIDVSTADKLELVASNSEIANEKYSSLYGILNYCITKIGARTLRATILQPPCSVPDIEARLDCIAELKQNTNMMSAIQTILPKISNIDQLLSLATLPSDQGSHFSEKHLTYVLTLNALLDMLEHLKDVFEYSQQPFFKEIKATLEDDFFRQLTTNMRTLIQPDAYPAKGHRGLIEKCFIIKPGVNGLLDVLRRTYSERVEDLKEYVNQLRDKYNLPLTLGNNHKKGYHIVLQLNAQTKKTFKKSDLPDEFLQVDRLFTSVTMKTTNLMNLAVRIEDILMEILKMNGLMVYEILVDVRNHIALFYKLCEEIAKLDMIQSLAQASSGIGYTRPEFGEYLEVTNSRHPLLDFLCSTEPVSNSVFASCDHNVHIITGPNGSGKSIFIRQVFLLQVMAQVGCFIPAEKALFRVCDRMLARIYFEDNMNCGASSFVLEVKEIQYFHTNVTPNTLIIIDELCRSTAIGEGTALAIAMVESLAKSQAFIFLTTHYIFVTKLEEFYPNVTNWQMETTEEVKERTILHFTYNLKPDITTLKKYGLCAAKNAWPQDIMEDAERLYNEIQPPKDLANVRGMNVAARLKYNLEAELKMLKLKRQLSATALLERVHCYADNLKRIEIDITKYVSLNAFEDHHYLNAAHNRHETLKLNRTNTSGNISYVSSMVMYPEVVYSPSNANEENNCVDYEQFCQEIEAKNTEHSQHSGIMLQNTTINSDTNENDTVMSRMMSQNINKLIINNQENMPNAGFGISSQNKYFGDVSSISLNCPNEDTSSENNPHSSSIPWASKSFVNSVDFKIPNRPTHLEDDSSISKKYLNESTSNNTKNANSNSIPWMSEFSSKNDFAISNQQTHFEDVSTISQVYQNQKATSNKDDANSNSIPWASKSFVSSNIYPNSNRQNFNNTTFDQDLMNITATCDTTIFLDNPDYLGDSEVTSAIQELHECSAYFTQEWEDMSDNISLTLQQHNDNETEGHDFHSLKRRIKESEGDYVQANDKKSNVIVHSVHVFDQNNQLVGVQKFNHGKDDYDVVKDQEVVSDVKKEVIQSQTSCTDPFEACNDFSEQCSSSFIMDTSLIGKAMVSSRRLCSINNLEDSCFKSKLKDGRGIKLNKQEVHVNKTLDNKNTTYRKQPTSLSGEFFKLQMQQDLSKISKVNEITNMTNDINANICEGDIINIPEQYEILNPDNDVKETSNKHLNFTEKAQFTCTASAQAKTPMANQNSWFSTVDRGNFNLKLSGEESKHTNLYIELGDPETCLFNFDGDTRNSSISANNTWFPVLSNINSINMSSDSHKNEIKTDTAKSQKSFCNSFFEIRAKKDALRIEQDCEKYKTMPEPVEESNSDAKYFSATNEKTNSEFHPRGFYSTKSNVFQNNVHGNTILSNGKYSLLDLKGDNKKATSNINILPNAGEKMDIHNTSHENIFSCSTNVLDTSINDQDVSSNNEEYDQNGIKLEEHHKSTVFESKVHINEGIKKAVSKNEENHLQDTAQADNIVDIGSDPSKFSETDKIPVDTANNTVCGELKNIQSSRRSPYYSKNSQQAYTSKLYDNTNNELIGYPCSCASTLILNKYSNSEKQCIPITETDTMHSYVQEKEIGEELEVIASSISSDKHTHLTKLQKKSHQTPRSLKDQHSMTSLNRYFEKNKNENLTNLNSVKRKDTTTLTKTFDLGGATSKSIFETSCMSESLFGSSPEDFFSAVDETPRPSTSKVSPPNKLKTSNTSVKGEKVNIRKSDQKFKTPLKTSENKTIPAKKIETKSVIKKPSRSAKFIPPKALSKKKILEDFEKQGRKILENSDDPDKIEKYMKFLANKPNVEQIQAQKYLAIFKKTNDGIVVIPASTPTTKAKKMVPLKRKLSATDFDKTVLSDKNVNKLNYLLQSEEKIFNFDKEENDNLFGDYDDCKKDSEIQLDKKNSSQKSGVQSDVNFSQSTLNSHTLVGYYTQNKNSIDNLINKYL